MNRILKHESSGFLFTLCFVSVSTFGLISFNNPYIFDVTYSLLLLLLTMLYRDNKDVFSLAIILVFAKLIGYWTVWLYDHYAPYLLFKLVIYSSCLVCCFVFYYQTLSKILLANIGLGIAAELYWYGTEYPAPEIHFHYVIAAHAIILRYLFLMRPAVFRFWQDVKPQKFDGNLNELFFASAIYSLIMALEYLVRHVVGINMLFFYNINEYVQHFIGLGVILVVLFYTISHPKYLRV